MTSTSNRPLEPFSSDARDGFTVYLIENKSKPRLTVTNKEDIISWLTDASRHPKDNKEANNRKQAKETFRWDSEKRILYTLPTEKHPQEREIVVESRIYEIIAYKHDLTGHAGMDATWSAIERHYYGIVRNEVRELVKKCQVCARKASNRSRGPLTPIVVFELFERVQVDLIDFRDTLDNEFQWVLHAKDHFSKYCQLYPLLDKQAVTVAQAMARWIGAFGAPKIVQSDNSKKFKGIMKGLLLRYGIQIINGRPRTPRTQRLVERANGTVKRKILV